MERLKRMSVFAKVVEFGSFTAAARQLQMSVSSISQTVSKLEDELQVKLLNRSTRSIGLTEAGRIYYQGCRRMLHEVQDVHEQLYAFNNTPIGELVASELCTVVDDGTMVDRRGSVAIDDEGTPGQYNVLIENGILKGYMQDKLNARLMGMTPTGNGRRESYAHLPMPRMTNTYMLPGKSTPQEIIESVEYGIYAPNFGGGQVDITSGKFVFSTSEAYLIENGKVTKPVKGATLIGSGIETMQQISMVGNDLKLDNGVGVCGKEGQSLPVGVGQPTLKVDNLTVGGTA